MSKSARFINRDYGSISFSHSLNQDKDIYYSQVFSNPNKPETEIKISLPSEVKSDSIDNNENVVKRKCSIIGEENRKGYSNELYYGLKLFSILNSGKFIKFFIF